MRTHLHAVVNFYRVDFTFQVWISEEDYLCANSSVILVSVVLVLSCEQTDRISDAANALSPVSTTRIDGPS